eukprot:UN00969
MLTMFSALTAPRLVADAFLQQRTAATEGQMSERQVRYLSQFCIPLLFQVILTPLHRLGYFMYENDKKPYTTQEIISFLKRDYFKSIGLRCIRSFAPWSIGQSINIDIRTQFASQSPRYVIPTTTDKRLD